MHAQSLRCRPRSYPSCRTENCQLGVFLAYAGRQGRTLVDRELYLPQGWCADDARWTEAAVPAEVQLATQRPRWRTGRGGPRPGLGGVQLGRRWQGAPPGVVADRRARA
ncbi:transposase [Micromonospora sp. ATA51]|uniref:transposase n=1 Tax=Micromonospora sp. ATA51 TaxID=2806098 RepID=UPI0035CB6BB9